MEVGHGIVVPTLAVLMQSSTVAIASYLISVPKASSLASLIPLIVTGSMGLLTLLIALKFSRVRYLFQIMVVLQLGAAMVYLQLGDSSAAFQGHVVLARLKDALKLILLASQLVLGYTCANFKASKNGDLKQVKADPERNITPNSLDTIVHMTSQRINNKDSLQTLVPTTFERNQSLLSIFRLRNSNSNGDLVISANASLDNLEHQHCHRYLQDDELIQREKMALSHISNSLLPPLLQKGENDLIPHPVIEPAIPRAPVGLQNFSTTSLPTDNTGFISLQDWEQNKHLWQFNAGGAGYGMNLSKAIADDEVPSLHSFREFSRVEEEVIEEDENPMESPISIMIPQEKTSPVKPTLPPPSVNRARSRSKPNPSSPIKKFFSHSDLQQSYKHHNHSRSMYSLESPKRGSSSNMRLFQLKTASASNLESPRRTKSLSPIKHTKKPSTVSVMSSTMKQDDMEKTEDDDHTPESPCPSGGFGEYDREKWRRIKLRMDKEIEEPLKAEADRNMRSESHHQDTTRKASGDIYIF